jgi:LysR family glycine cleavage system transcriptional activator
MDVPASLDALRVLAACVRHGNFTRAAAELCVTPSAVSARIRGLEAELGATLFERRGPKLVPTERAVQLATTVDRALESIRSAVTGAQRQRAPLRVTCAPAFARWLVPQLARYHDRADAAPIALDATIEQQPNDRFDVAIRYGRGPWSGASAALLAVDRGVAMASPKLLGGKPCSSRRVLDLPLLRDARWPRWFERAGIRNANPRFAATRFKSYELEAAAAVQGIGVALLSPFVYADLVEERALVVIGDAAVDGPDSYWVLWHDEAATGFVTWLQAAVTPGAG